MVRISIIMDRQIARVPGSPVTTSMVASVSALMGLKHKLPHSLSQISSRISARIGASKPAATSARCRRSTRSLRWPRGSPIGNLLPCSCCMTPGATTSVAGNTTQPMARSGPRSFRCRPPGSMLSTSAPESVGFARAEKPVRQAVARGDDAGLRAKQGSHGLDGARDGVRLERDDHVVLLSQVRADDRSTRRARRAIRHRSAGASRSRESRQDERRERQR